jgi:hypothetical protein
MLDDVLLVSRMRFICSRLCSTQLTQDISLVGQRASPAILDRVTLAIEASTRALS